MPLGTESWGNEPRERCLSGPDSLRAFGDFTRVLSWVPPGWLFYGPAQRLRNAVSRSGVSEGGCLQERPDPKSPSGGADGGPGTLLALLPFSSASRGYVFRWGFGKPFGALRR